MKADIVGEQGIIENNLIGDSYEAAICKCARLLLVKKEKLEVGPNEIECPKCGHIVTLWIGKQSMSSIRDFGF